MAAILSRYLGYIGIAIITCCVLSAIAYRKGYNAAETRYQKEKIELIQQKEREKADIIAKIRQKSPVERRKALKRYVVK